MSKLKNLAGKIVKIFICQFELNERDNIEFVVNESIYNDMYPSLQKEIMFHVKILSDTLNSYRNFCKSNILMDMNFITYEESETVLNNEIIDHLSQDKLEFIFSHSDSILDIIEDGMNRKDIERKTGKMPK